MPTRSSPTGESLAVAAPAGACGAGCWPRCCSSWAPCRRRCSAGLRRPATADGALSRLPVGPWTRAPLVRESGESDPGPRRTRGSRLEEEMSVRTVYSVCGMCAVRCPIEAEVEDGRCRFIQGNRQSRRSAARCARAARPGSPAAGRRTAAVPHAAARAAAARADWQRISWDEALCDAAEQIAAVRCGAWRPQHPLVRRGRPLQRSPAGLRAGLGSPNYFDPATPFHAAHTGSTRRSRSSG